MHFGILTEHSTGLPLRTASAEEWRCTALALNGITSGAGGETGAWRIGEDGEWTDGPGRVVYVDGGPDMEVTDGDIDALAREAAAHGDWRQEEQCRIALGGDGYARSQCVMVILAARAQDGE
jgi:hypothetical protein